MTDSWKCSYFKCLNETNNFDDTEEILNDMTYDMIIHFLTVPAFFPVSSLRREGYTMQVNVNDYLDIYCPHYNDSQRMVGTGEQYVLYMVSYRGYRNCDPQMGFKRWECNRPHAPHAPIKFSEKFQRYSAFSLGYEFHVGQEYYYICEWNQTNNQYHVTIKCLQNTKETVL